ncbi:unnamed protein product [Victoria cruziana]
MPFSGDTLSGGAFDDFLSDERNFSGEGIEWLSAFVEDCFSGGGGGPGAAQVGSMVDVAAKRRSKRRRAAGGNPGRWSNGEEEEEEEEEEKGGQEEEKEWDKDLEGYDPPLLDQAYWLADSELIVQKKIKEVEDSHVEGGSKTEDNGSAAPTLPAAAAAGAAAFGLAVGSPTGSSEGSNGQQQPRRCSHCLAQRTPQWRAGPLGPKTLCNACGVRFKSGRLLPEYRPAKSPTFVSYKHSNSHKKVMEMRMSMSVAASD